MWEQEESRPSPRPFAEMREELKDWGGNQGFFRHKENRDAHEILRGDEALGLRRQRTVPDGRGACHFLSADEVMAVDVPAPGDLQGEEEAL